MTAFRTLYYPSWDPPVKWLRSMLLYLDGIEVILPMDVEPHYHRDNDAVFELIPHVFTAIRSAKYELGLDDAKRTLLGNCFAVIADETETVDSDIEITIHEDGNWSLDGYSFLHRSKTDDYVQMLLAKHGLVDETRTKYGIESGLADSFQAVNADASCLILSLLAESIAKERRLSTLTDRPMDYILNTLEAANPVARSEAAMQLASSILIVEVPEKIETLSAKNYVELRERYGELREPFHRAMLNLCDDHSLAELRTPAQFQEAVREATRDFCVKSEQVRRGMWAKDIKSWSPVALCVLSGICALTGNVAAAIGTGISVMLNVYQGLQPSPYTTNAARSQRLLGELKRELSHPALLRKIVLPGR